MVTAAMLLLMKIMTTITKINFDGALMMCQARCSVLDLRYCILPKHFYSVPRSHDLSIIVHTLTGMLVMNFSHFTAYWSSRIPSVFWGILLYISKQHFNHIYMYTCMYIYIIWLLYTYMYIKNRVFKVCDISSSIYPIPEKYWATGKWLLAQQIDTRAFGLSAYSLQLWPAE